MTTIYRVVSRAEKEDYDASGAFRTNQNTLEAKQFFKSVDAINEFIENARLQSYYPPYEYLFMIKVDTQLFNSINKTEMILDGYDAINIHEDLLPDFNNCIIFVTPTAI